MNIHSLDKKKKLKINNLSIEPGLNINKKKER